MVVYPNYRRNCRRCNKKVDNNLNIGEGWLYTFKKLKRQHELGICNQIVMSCISTISEVVYKQLSNLRR